MPQKKGLFITLEGGEGSGKSTQARLLANYLSKLGYQVVTTIEPGGTKVGTQIRNILLAPKNRKMIPLTELFLYLSSRAQLVQEIVLPALQQGKAVICDRYIDSSVAYQGIARKLGMELVEQLNRIATNGLQPAITLYFDIAPNLGLARKAIGVKGKMDRLEKERIAFHRLVRKGYLQLAKKYPSRIKVIPVKATNSPNQIFRLVEKEINKLI